MCHSPTSYHQATLQIVPFNLSSLELLAAGDGERAGCCGPAANLREERVASPCCDAASSTGDLWWQHTLPSAAGLL